MTLLACQFTVDWKSLDFKIFKHLSVEFIKLVDFPDEEYLAFNTATN